MLVANREQPRKVGIIQKAKELGYEVTLFNSIALQSFVKDTLEQQGFKAINDYANQTVSYEDTVALTKAIVKYFES